MAADAHDIAMGEKFVEGVVDNHLAPRDAARIAGYSDTTKIRDITVGSPVVRALEARGLNDEFLAETYANAIELSMSDDAEKKDLQATAKLLLQIGYLKGYGRQAPQVAVQINNAAPGAQAAGDIQSELERVTETLRRVEELIGLVEAELGERDVAGLHGPSDPMARGDQIHTQAAPRDGVGEAGGDA